METSSNSSLKLLRDALLALRPTGPDGFEGLIATVLSEISGTPFRLAASGSQHGRDGGTTAVPAHIVFECKLYTTKINKDDVLAKVAEVGLQNDTDLWVLAATVELTTQVASLLQALTAKLGLPALILDWTAGALPRLAVLCAGAGHATSQFLLSNLTDKALAQSAGDTLAEIGNQPGFSAQFGDIKRELFAPTTGIAAAGRANADWLNRLFSDKPYAQSLLGQTLTPLAQTGMSNLDRSAITDDIVHKLSEPNGDILAVVGDEGCGKSWALAQGMLRCAGKTLAVIIPAKAIESSTFNPVSFRQLLTDKLLEQTGSDLIDTDKGFWARKFAAWRNSAAARTRLIVCIDGLNENAAIDWRRWLGGANLELAAMGGKLAFSSRQAFFTDNILEKGLTPLATVSVPEWTDSELDAVLAEKKVPLDQITSEVRASLRNPRVLGIAVNLFNSEQITGFNELSVARLLFEYMRLAAQEDRLGENRSFFVRRLTQHAKAVSEKARRQETQALETFDIADFAGPGKNFSLSAELLYASEGLFYKANDDSTSYTLSDDGLNLALGTEVIASLQRAEKSGHDVAEALQTILEPISALDRTADVIFAAMIVACIDNTVSNAVRASLIAQFLSLQNIDQAVFPAFASIARVATAAATEALGTLSLSAREGDYTEWLLSALRAQHDHAQNWQVISSYIDRWLRIQSLAPHLGIFPYYSEDTRRQEHLDETEKKLADRLNNLSATERNFLETELARDDTTDTAALVDTVYLLLAGRPLAPLAKALVARVFGNCINSSIQASGDGFDFLIIFNRVDWAETKLALLEAVAPFDAPGVSRVGQHTLKRVLGAIGTVQEGQKADALDEALWPEELKEYRGRTLRRVENYAETDPCDPNSTFPANIVHAIKALEELDLSNLYRGRWVTMENHTLDDTACATARFAPAVAINMQRRVNREILSIDMPAFKYGAFALPNRSAVLEENQVAVLLSIASHLSVGNISESRENKDKWIASQFALLASMPHLSGNEQLSALTALPPHGCLLLQVCDVLVPATEQAMEMAFERASISNQEEAQSTILAFACYSKSPISARSREIIGEFLRKPRGTVRSIALQLASRLKDDNLAKQLTESGWPGDDFKPDNNRIEHFYGSKLLIHGAKLGFLSPAEFFPKITPELYKYAVDQLGEPATTTVVTILQTAITKILEARTPFIPPVAEENIDLKERESFAYWSIEDEGKPRDFKESIDRLNESDEDYSARQQRAHAKFDEFQEAMSRQDAALILRNLGHPLFEAIYNIAPEMVMAWATRIAAVPKIDLPKIKNVGLAVAATISEAAPSLAVTLFERLGPAAEFLRLTYGASKVPFEAICIWRSAENEALNLLRIQRLERANHNQEIAMEVNAALLTRKQPFLTSVITEWLKSDIPVVQARAVMICGFLDQNALSEQILTARKDEKGLAGDAARQALYAYERNIWSRHWYQQMAKADTPENFWCYSTLLVKIVDFRIDLWANEYELGPVAKRFMPLVDKEIDKRIKKWGDERQKKLFALKVPDARYLGSAA